MPPFNFFDIVLFVISTPIGNLQDISARAISTLNACEYVLCEDTRHSRPLLDKFDIKKPLYSYHQHNEAYRSEKVIADLKDDLSIGLISDAGTPGISDPGHVLIEQCYAENIRVVPIPGACAVITALSASPLPTDRFQFIGFLPKQPGALSEALEEAIEYDGSTVCYESPQRLLKTLQALNDLSPDVPVAVCRELTKLHEEIIYKKATDQVEHFTRHPPKGEIVLIIGHYKIEKKFSFPPEKLIAWLLEEGLSKRDALQAAAKSLGVSRNLLYRLLMDKE